MANGQAAMEFLMTYGWVLLVIILALGVFAYLGILSPTRLLPDKCIATTPFGCSEYKVSGESPTNNVMLLITNGDADMADVMIGLTCHGGISALPVAGTSGPLASGGQMSANFTCPQPKFGTRWRGNFSIVFTKLGETVSHSVDGSITVTAE